MVKEISGKLDEKAQENEKGSLKDTKELTSPEIQEQKTPETALPTPGSAQRSIQGIGYSDTKTSSEPPQEQQEAIKTQEATSQETTDTNEITQLKSQYFEDLSKNSRYPTTLDRKILEGKWEKLNPDELAAMRADFETKKGDLITSWEEQNKTPWPTYDKDVYSENGRLIRREGNKYDAHHIQPLSMGGKNSAENITPLEAAVHYDKQGIHSPGSPYSSIAKKLAFEGE